MIVNVLCELQQRERLNFHLPMQQSSLLHQEFIITHNIPSQHMFCWSFQLLQQLVTSLENSHKLLLMSGIRRLRRWIIEQMRTNGVVTKWKLLRNQMWVFCVSDNWNTGFKREVFTCLLKIFSVEEESADTKPVSCVNQDDLCRTWIEQQLCTMIHEEWYIEQ